jgi:hypothetical protein
VDQYFRYHIGEENELVKIKLSLFASIVFALALGCNRSEPSKDLLDDLSQKQRNDQLAIGWVDGQKLELIMFGTKPELQDYVLSPGQAQEMRAEAQAREKQQQTGEGSDSQRSPDGKWITYRTPKNDFVLADSTGKIQRTFSNGDKILTSLYWSPNSEYLMYVKKSDKLDTGCLRYMEDGRDVMVYRLRDGRQGRVYQVCQGYPFTRFGWLIIPSNLSKK